MEPDKHTNQKSKTSKLSAFIATFLVVVLAVLVFLYHDKLSPSSISEVSGSKAQAVSNSDPFTYENGSKQMFTLMGDDLAIASTTGLQLLDSEGKTISRQIFSMSNPAVCSNGNFSAFYDVGGKSLRVYKDGDYTSLDRENAIISVSVNNSGFLAVTEEEAGYKGSVTVYNSNLNSVYKWYSGSGYTLDAVVSPDNNTLAVLCVESSGSVIHLFHLDSETELSSISIPNELAFKLCYNSDGKLCSLSEDAVYFFSSEGKQLSTYSFERNYLANYNLSDEFCSVVLSKYVSGSNVSLISFTSDGKVLANVSLSDEPVMLFSQKQKLLVLDASGITLYSRDLRVTKQNQIVPGYISAVLLSKGTVLLLSSHFGEEYKFS